MSEKIKEMTTQLAHIESIIRMQKDYINLVRDPKQLSKDDIFMAYIAVYEALDTWFEIDQNLISQIESISSTLDDMEAEEDE